MLRSLFSGVSGLTAYQQKLDVISNNIANVNTTGYKAQRVTFSDVFNQTISGATAPDATTGRGGRNPMQVGLGVGISSIDTLTTRGSTELTGYQTDLAIDGNGYFIVRNGNSGPYLFTRAGNFCTDEAGNLVTAEGSNVYGWEDYSIEDGNYKFDTNKEVGPINPFKNKGNISGEVTTTAELSGNLNSAETPKGSEPSSITLPVEPDFTTTYSAYDALGNKYDVEMNFTKCYVEDDATPVTTWYYSVGSGENYSSASTGYIKFDQDGKIINETGFEQNVTVPINTASTTGTADFEIAVDFSGLSMSSDNSSVTASYVDGCQPGSLEDYSIGSDGIITGIYSNGLMQPLGMIAVAKFDNPAGLMREGSNNFSATSNSGEFTNGVAAGTQGTGMFSVGCLEMSNVDLSREFSEMIIAQRGFQANSRIITTSDEILQELINLKR